MDDEHDPAVCITKAGNRTTTTRNSEQGEAISMTTRYAYERFASFGLTVAYHDYVWNVHNTGDADRVPSRSRTYRQGHNVTAEKPGLVDPGRIYLLTAHVDDLPEGPRAPGADDNGSGTVVILTAARLLAPYDFAYTIRFVLFTGEGQGMHGSGAYAADCLARGEDIRGVVNLDMIAYNSDTEPIIDLYGSGRVPASLEVTRVFSDMIDFYGLDLLPHRFDIPSGFPIEKEERRVVCANGMVVQPKHCYEGPGGCDFAVVSTGGGCLLMGVILDEVETQSVPFGLRSRRCDDEARLPGLLRPARLPSGQRLSAGTHQAAAL